MQTGWPLNSSSGSIMGSTELLSSSSLCPDGLHGDQRGMDGCCAHSFPLSTSVTLAQVSSCHRPVTISLFTTRLPDINKEHENPLKQPSTAHSILPVLPIFSLLRLAFVYLFLSSLVPISSVFVSTDWSVSYTWRKHVCADPGFILID